MKKGLPFLLLLLLFISNRSYSQDQLGLYYCGLTVHGMGDKNAVLMPLKLGPDGVFVINVGMAAQYRKNFNERWSLDIVQTVQADCAFKLSAGTGIGLGYDILQSKAHQLIVSGGPGIFIRDSWHDLEGYQKVRQLKLSENEKLEYLFVPVVPRLEYAWVPEGKRIGFSTYCIFDPLDFLLNMGFGITYLLQ